MYGLTPGNRVGLGESGRDEVFGEGKEGLGRL